MKRDFLLAACVCVVSPLAVHTGAQAVPKTMEEVHKLHQDRFS